MDITPSLNLACVHAYISASTSVFMHVVLFFPSASEEGGEATGKQLVTV